MAYPLLDPGLVYCAQDVSARRTPERGGPVMKTAVGLITTTIMTAMVATGASAEWRLYVNRDNRAWSLERAYVSNDECDRAARTLYRSGQALGVGCAEYPPPSAAPAPVARPVEYARPNPTTQRSVARADDPARVSTSRSSASRGTDYSPRSTTSRQVAERAFDPAATTASHPAAVIFPPSGGIEIRSDEAPAPAPTVVASRPVAEPRRHAAPVTPHRVPEDAAAVALAKAATEGAVVSAREVAAEAAKREELAAADKAERRTQLAIFGGIALVVTTGVAYSVYRAARTSPLRALAVGLIELGVLTSALAYPVVELWNRLKISNLVLSSWMPGLFAGIVIAGVGLIVLALELTRKPARPKAVPARDVEHKPQAPVELIKPGEHVKTGDPGKPVEPVRPLQPVRPLEPVRPLGAAPPVEPVKPPAAPAPAVGGSLADRLTR
jgi:hypothetical protein